MKLFFTGVLFLISSFMALNSVALGSGLDVFQSQVYPILTANCGICHAGGQRPHHSNADVHVAYQEALKVLNVQEFEKSTIWLRSFSNHCQIPERCGVKRPELLTALENWAKEEIPPADEFEFINEMSISIPREINEVGSFQVAGKFGELYGFSIKRVSESYVMVYDQEIKNVQSHLAFDGFELRSADVIAQHQNFGNYKLLVKPIIEGSLNLSETSSGYILYRLNTPDADVASLQFYLKNMKINFDRETAKSLHKEGHHLLFSQYENKPKKLFVGSLASLDFLALVTDGVEDVHLSFAQTQIVLQVLF